MKKISLFFLFSFLSLSGFNTLAEDKNEKREKIVAITKDEINTARHLYIANPENGKEYLYRVIEASYELLKLVNEKENENFLSQSEEQQSKIRRKDAYKSTNKLSDQINIDGNQYLKKFRKTPETVQVLYILAFIEEHFKKNRIKCRDYLLEAVKICPSNHPSFYPIHEMLADNLFNLDEFESAYKYYLVLLKDKSSPWWTKFAYNASWSLLKLKKFNEALSLMLEAYRLSKNPQYKNFSEQAMRNLPNFFVYSDRKKEGITFLKEQSSNSREDLFNYAKILFSKGFTDLALLAIAEIDKEIINGKNYDLKLQLLSVFYEYKIRSHFMNLALLIAKEIKNQELDSKQKEEFIMLVNNYLVEEQKVINKAIYDSTISGLLEISQYAKNLLSILIMTDSLSSYRYYYALGEIAYFLKNYPESLAHYMNAFKLTPKDNLKYKIKILDAMLGVLALQEINEKNQDIHLFVYSNYIELLPKDQKTRLIYPKIINLFLYKKDLKKAYDYVYLYNKNFPQDTQIQQELVVKILDRTLESDLPLFSLLLANIKKGDFNFPSSDINKFNNILGNLLFNKANDLVKEGKSKEALNKYTSYNQNPSFPAEIRQKSAYNAFILLLVMKDYDESEKWFNIWLASAEKDKDGNPDLKPILTYINNLYLEQQIERASRIADKGFQVACKNKQSNLKNDFIQLDLIYGQEKYSAAEISSLLDRALQCGCEPKVILSLSKLILNNLMTPNSSEKFYSLASLLENNKFYGAIIVNAYYEYLLYSRSNSDQLQINVLEKKITNIYPQVQNDKNNLSLAIPAYLETLNFNDYLIELKKIQLSFPLELFSDRLGLKMNLLQKLTQKVLLIAKRGQPLPSVLAYKFLSLFITQMEQDFLSFNPPISDPASLNNFQNEVKKIIKGLEEKKQSYLILTSKIINEAPMLEKENMEILNDQIQVFYLYQAKTKPVFVEMIDQKGELK